MHHTKESRLKEEVDRLNSMIQSREDIIESYRDKINELELVVRTLKGIINDALIYRKNL